MTNELLIWCIISVFLLIVILTSSYGIWRFARDLSQSLAGYGIPYVMTPDEKIQMLLNNLKLQRGEIFIDIGCGDGLILESVKNRFRDAKVIGYEKSARPYQDALKRKEKNGLNYEIRNEDFFTSDISEANVLYSYMITYMMARIWKKVESECKKGTLLYSSSFPIPEMKPREILNAGEKKIYLYEV